MKELIDALERHPITAIWLIVVSYLLTLRMLLDVLT